MTARQLHPWDFADDDESIAAMACRFAHVYKPGDRVRARLDLISAQRERPVPAGTLGNVQTVRPSRVLVVAWDDVPADSVDEAESFATSPDCVVPVRPSEHLS